VASAHWCASRSARKIRRAPTSTIEPGFPPHRRARLALAGPDLLHGLEHLAAEDRLVLAAMHLTPIGNLADVEPVLEQMGERPHAKANTAALLARMPPGYLIEGIQEQFH
jgi:hypothetical protein